MLRTSSTDIISVSERINFRKKEINFKERIDSLLYLLIQYDKFDRNDFVLNCNNFNYEYKIIFLKNEIISNLKNKIDDNKIKDYSYAFYKKSLELNDFSEFHLKMLYKIVSKD